MNYIEHLKWLTTLTKRQRQVFEHIEDEMRRGNKIVYFDKDDWGQLTDDDREFIEESVGMRTNGYFNACRFGQGGF